jgi:hypothetical protein
MAYAPFPKWQPGPPESWTGSPGPGTPTQSGRSSQEHGQPVAVEQAGTGEDEPLGGVDAD